MAGATLNLPALQALIALGGYGGRGNNAPSTSVIGLSAALFLSDLTIWQGAGDTLTSGEIDDIQELVAQLECDLMMTDNDYPIDRVKLTSSVLLAIPTGTSTTLLWDTVIYNPADMYNPALGTHKINVKNNGLHIINASILFAPRTLGSRQLSLFHYDNSLDTLTGVASVLNVDPSGVYANTLILNYQGYAEIDDYYLLTVWQDSGSDLNILSYDFTPRFEGVRF
ncbi:hypothetical protein KAR91_14385 [Candidatus Pacearchaeota archaeon]|nr:hypothetical protein [Candidatus Pacearchaeota archaeon]